MNWFQRRMEQEQGGPIPEPRPSVINTHPQAYQQGNLPAPSPAARQAAVDVEQMEHTPENVKLLMNYWTGGEGTKTETTRCPACGGDHYFSRASGTMRGPAPAPMCYSCGYNGMFEQADQSTWSAP
jgi:hypothetical protein